LSKLPAGRVGAAPLSNGGVGLSGGLCGSALAWRFGDGLATSITVLAVGCRDRSLARGAAATALGLDVADFIFGADGSIGASLCAAGG